MPTATILISAQPQTATDDVRDVLRTAGFATADHRLGSVPAVALPPHVAAIVCPADVLEPALAQTRRWRVELGDTYVPIVWVLGMPSAEWSKAALDAGADACLARPLDGGLFLAQLNALRRVRGAADRLLAKGDDARVVAERLRATHDQIDRDLAVARALHRALTPDRLPDVGAIRFGLYHRPRSRAGGDVVDAWPAGAEVEFVLADAAGSVGPFVLQRLAAAVRGPAGAVPPGDVLQRINRALVHLKLDDPPVTAMAFGRVAPATGAVALARAGLPHPVHVPAAGPVAAWAPPGPLLGVGEAAFPTHAAALAPGDKLLLATDGALTVEADAAPLLAAAAAHRALPAQPFADAVAADLLRQLQPADDVTLLVVERAVNP